MFQISSAHVYFTYPFVLSWSMLEAMSCGCVVIGSDTTPVKEFISDGINGYLTPFKDINALAETATKVLTDKSKNNEIRIAARSTIQSNYDLNEALSAQIKLVESFQA